MPSLAFTPHLVLDERPLVGRARLYRGPIRLSTPGNGISYPFTGRVLVGSALAVDGVALRVVAFATQTSADPDESRYPGFTERRARFPR
jgi:hypothetical protein